MANWGSFNDFMAAGYNARTVCCVCGGGKHIRSGGKSGYIPGSAYKDTDTETAEDDTDEDDTDVKAGQDDADTRWQEKYKPPHTQWEDSGSDDTDADERDDTDEEDGGWNAWNKAATKQNQETEEWPSSKASRIPEPAPWTAPAPASYGNSRTSWSPPPAPYPWAAPESPPAPQPWKAPSPAEESWQWPASSAEQGQKPWRGAAPAPPEPEPWGASAPAPDRWPDEPQYEEDEAEGVSTLVKVLIAVPVSLVVCLAALRCYRKTCGGGGGGAGGRGSPPASLYGRGSGSRAWDGL